MAQEVESAISEKEVAQRLGVSTRTVQRWRWSEEGPPYLKYPSGTVRYDWSDVAEWKRNHRRFHTTPEDREAWHEAQDTIAAREEGE